MGYLIDRVIIYSLLDIKGCCETGQRFDLVHGLSKQLESFLKMVFWKWAVKTSDTNINHIGFSKAFSQNFQKSYASFLQYKCNISFHDKQSNNMFFNNWTDLNQTVTQFVHAPDVICCGSTVEIHVPKREADVQRFYIQ